MMKLEPFPENLGVHLKLGCQSHHALVQLDTSHKLWELCLHVASLHANC